MKGIACLKSKKWWNAAGTRAIKTVAQAAISSIAVNIAIWDVDWRALIGVTVLSGIVSLLTSLGGIPEVEE